MENVIIIIYKDAPATWWLHHKKGKLSQRTRERHSNYFN
jgi:hypothetical protein